MDLFEVVEAVSHLDGSVRYRLEPWPDRHAVRSIQSYDAASEIGRARDKASHRTNVVRRRLAILFSPLLGHLPGRVQERMESEFGAPAIAMTVVSALPLLALGTVSGLLTFAAMAGAAFAPGDAASSTPSLLPLPVAVYLFFESGVRLGAAFLQARPIGSVPGTFVYAIYSAFRGGAAVAPLSSTGLPATAERALFDRFRMLEPLLALLSPEEQESLERRFGMELLRWGKVTAVLLLVIGAANVFTSVVIFSAGEGGFGDLLWLLAGAGLTLEQVGRLRTIARGQPAGSFLGAVVRPLARKLLEEPESKQPSL